MNRIRQRSLPRDVRDWVMNELEALGWEPLRSWGYNRRMQAPAMIRQLITEAATREEFARHVNLLDYTYRDESTLLHWAWRWKRIYNKPRAGVETWSKVEQHIFGRQYKGEAAPLSYVVDMTIGGKRRRVSFPTLELAQDFKRRLLAAVEAGQPLESVPVFSQPSQ